MVIAGMFVKKLHHQLVSFGLMLVCAACGSAPSATGAVSGGATNPNSNSTVPAPSGGSAGTVDTSPQGSGTSKGAVQGQTLKPQSAASATYINGGDFLLVVLSSQQDYCAATTAGQTHANHRSMASILFSVDQNGESSQALGVGTYTITPEAPTAPGLFANAVFNASDASCQSLLEENAGAATSGTISLTAITSKAASGTYSLKFGADVLSGSFSAPDCVALADQAASGAGLTCEP